MKRAVWHVAACALVLLSVSVLPALAQAVSDPVDATAAKREGAVVWYTSTPVELAQRIAEMFEHETGIRVQLFRTGGSALLRRFMQEESAGRVFADLLTMSDQAAARVFAEKGLFVPFKPKGFDKVISSGKDAEGRFVAQRMTLIGMLVRADKVPQSDWPKTWIDLRSPKYKGMMVMTDPSFTAIQLMTVGTLSRLYGWDFYQDLRKYDTMVVEGHEQAFDTIQRGERVVAAEGTNPRVYTRGRPVTNVVALYPATQAILVPSPTAVVKGGPHPNAAKLFAQFQISPEVQRLFRPMAFIPRGSISSRPPACRRSMRSSRCRSTTTISKSTLPRSSSASRRSSSDRGTSMNDRATAAPAVAGQAHWTESHGARLFLWEKPCTAGTPQGAIVFVHGSSMGSQASFDLQAPGVEDSSTMEWFAARGFDAWCFDCRGYGRSDKPADVLATVADGAEDLAAASRYIMETRGTGPLFVYGTSSGALRAAFFAERHPERVRRLALDALVWTGKDSPILAQRRKRLPELLKSPRRPLDRAALASIFTRDRPGTARDDIVEPFIAAVLALEDSVPNGTYIDMCANLPLVDPARITMPTLVLRGQYDGIASVDDVYEFFRRLPNPEKEFCMVPGVAHSSLKQKNYQRTLHALHSFFTRPAPVYREG